MFAKTVHKWLEWFLLKILMYFAHQRKTINESYSHNTKTLFNEQIIKKLLKIKQKKYTNQF